VDVQDPTFFMDKDEYSDLDKSLQEMLTYFDNDNEQL